MIADGFCRFTLEGVPVGKGRPRAFRVGKGLRMHTPAKTAAYEAAVALSAKAAMGGQKPFSGAVAGWLTFSMPIPASWPHRKAQDARLGVTRHLSTPDLDNLAKAILDGCNGVVFEDDRQVVKLSLTKRYADRPGVAVSFEEMKNG